MAESDRWKLFSKFSIDECTLITLGYDHIFNDLNSLRMLFRQRTVNQSQSWLEYESEYRTYNHSPLDKHELALSQLLPALNKGVISEKEFKQFEQMSSSEIEELKQKIANTHEAILRAFPSDSTYNAVGDCHIPRKMFTQWLNTHGFEDIAMKLTNVSNTTPSPDGAYHEHTLSKHKKEDLIWQLILIIDPSLEKKGAHAIHAALESRVTGEEKLAVTPNTLETYLARHLKP